MKKLFLSLLIICGCFARFDAQAQRLPAQQSPVSPVEPIMIRQLSGNEQCRQWVDSVLNKMNLKERIGQLFIYTIAPQQNKANRDLLRKWWMTTKWVACSFPAADRKPGGSDE